jgi:flagellar assembly protein FliH
MAEIFKSNEPSRNRIIDPTDDPSRQLSVFERKMLRVQQEADELKAQAQAEMEALIEKARVDAEGIRKKAYTEGVEKGKSESIERIDKLASALRAKIDALQETQEGIIRQAATGIIDFSLKLAKLIICDEVKSNPAIVEKHLERILERLNAEGRIVIHVSNEDFEIVDTYMRETGAGFSGNDYEIKADPSVGRGGVKVDASSMGIDGSIEGMFKRVEAILLDMLGEDE